MKNPFAEIAEFTNKKLKNEWVSYEEEIRFQTLKECRDWVEGCINNLKSLDIICSYDKYGTRLEAAKKALKTAINKEGEGK